jgi:hypothetical protein
MSISIPLAISRSRVDLSVRSCAPNTKAGVGLPPRSDQAMEFMFSPLTTNGRVTKPLQLQEILALAIRTTCGADLRSNAFYISAKPHSATPTCATRQLPQPHRLRRSFDTLVPCATTIFHSLATALVLIMPALYLISKYVTTAPSGDTRVHSISHPLLPLKLAVTCTLHARKSIQERPRGSCSVTTCCYSFV